MVANNNVRPVRHILSISLITKFPSHSIAIYKKKNFNKIRVLCYFLQLKKVAPSNITEYFMRLKERYTNHYSTNWWMALQRYFQRHFYSTSVINDNISFKIVSQRWRCVESARAPLVMLSLLSPMLMDVNISIESSMIKCFITLGVVGSFFFTTCSKQGWDYI
jgi:hypothetical protein